MPDATAAARQRQRLHRRRWRQGRWVVQIEAWPDLIDALEIAGFGPAAGIETREDEAAAITAVLLRWESNIDRLRPAGMDVTRDGGGDGTVTPTGHVDRMSIPVTIPTSNITRSGCSPREAAVELALPVG